MPDGNAMQTGYTLVLLAWNMKCELAMSLGLSNFVSVTNNNIDFLQQRVTKCWS
jgi:hypothetical protein